MLVWAPRLFLFNNQGEYMKSGDKKTFRCPSCEEEFTVELGDVTIPGENNPIESCLFCSGAMNEKEDTIQIHETRR